MTIENSRADALTEKQRHAVDEAAKVLRDNWEHGTAEDLLMAFLPESSDPQPAAAPIDGPTAVAPLAICNADTKRDPELRAWVNAPLVAAAAERLRDWPKMAPREVFYAGWRAARAASANETEAEGAKPIGFRTRVPGFAWVPWLTDDQETIQRAIADALAHGHEGEAIYGAPVPAMAAEAVGEAGAMPGTDGFTMAAFRAADVPIGTKLYVAPPPAQADARVGLTKQHAEAVGCLTVRRFRGADSMVNTDFDYYGNLPDGSYPLYIGAAPEPRARMTDDRITELYRDCRHPTVGWAHRFARAIESEVAQPEPRAEATDEQIIDLMYECDLPPHCEPAVMDFAYRLLNAARTGASS